MRTFTMSNGDLWEVGTSGTIVSARDTDLIGGIVRNPKVGNKPVITLLGNETVTSTLSIKEIEDEVHALRSDEGNGKAKASRAAKGKGG